MATYKIHPAIGIARVGNSPSEFFVGPERVLERPNPPGGFKDKQCRVKRQAARFRIFAHHEDGTTEEITDAEADISWTVHVANKKATFDRGNSETDPELTIDAGAQTLDGPNQKKSLDGGSIHFAETAAPVPVSLGEVRTDTDNHLLVLGGLGKAESPAGTIIGHFWGNEDWYDDTSDGSVSASIKIRATGETFSVAGAWVIVAPPKFAPHIDSVITLYDRVQQAMIDGGLLAAPSSTEYTKDVYPILERTRTTRWVENIGTYPHGWTDPVDLASTRQSIFNRLSSPSGGSDMPDLNGSDGRLTATQYAHMERWKDGDYATDWSGTPSPPSDVSPAGLDQAALEACVGGAFFPGIEAGGLNASSRPIIDPSNYSEAFRVDHSSVSPGDMTKTMALPWQADFKACGDNWWPVPRPNEVIPQGTSTYQEWDRGVGSMEEMAEYWDTLGFVVRQGDQHVEVERCDTASITLLTPTVNFIDVPQGPMGMVREVALAINFEVISPTSDVTLEYTSGGAPAHPQLVAANSSVTVGPTSGTSVATARLWLIFRATELGSIPVQILTVKQGGGTQEWEISVLGNAVARKTAATALVLDRSGSMSGDRGDGQTKHKSLQEASSIFVDLMLEGDGVGVVRYDHDAQPLQSVKTLGAGGLSDLNREQTKAILSGSDLDPAGATSIGDGIHEGRALLDAASGYDIDSLVVLTDGVENSSQYISDVAADIDEKTYAIGLGTPQNTSSAALQSISGNNGGFLLVTGAIDTENRFLLQKYFLQVLAGVSNAEVVLDPDGELLPGAVHRIPFQLTRADAGVDVILLTPYAQYVDFRVQTPTGQIIEPWRAEAEPSMRHVISDGVSYYRLVLPAELAQNRFDHSGTWHALLQIGRPKTKPNGQDGQGVHREILHLGGVTHRKAVSRRNRLLDQRRHREAAAAGCPMSAMATNSVRTTQQSGAGGVGTVAAGSSSNAGAHAASFGPMQIAQTHDSSSGNKIKTVPYSLVVHTYSNLSFQVSAEQSGFEPGAKTYLNARISESGLPSGGRASVWAEMVAPDGAASHLSFSKTDEGAYFGSFMAKLPGVYRLRVRARGETRRGEVFTREQNVTATVWRGGDSPQGANGGARTDRVCEVLACLLREKGPLSNMLQRAQEWGLSAGEMDDLRRCLKEHCGKKTPASRG